LDKKKKENSPSQSLQTPVSYHNEEKMRRSAAKTLRSLALFSPNTVDFDLGDEETNIHTTATQVKSEVSTLASASNTNNRFDTHIACGTEDGDEDLEGTESENFDINSETSSAESKHDEMMVVAESGGNEKAGIHEHNASSHVHTLVSAIEKSLSSTDSPELKEAANRLFHSKLLQGINTSEITGVDGRDGLKIPSGDGGQFRVRVALAGGPPPPGTLTMFSREIPMDGIGDPGPGSIPTPGDADGAID